jgi:hypothetical protein
LPHHPGRDRKKVNLVGDLSLVEVEQFQVGFMDERGSLERMIRALPAQVPGSDPMQLLI